MLDSLNKYFALLSAALLIISAAVAMAFEFAYLSVFDWTVIWVVEYSDLAKFLLMSIALLAGVLTIVTNIGENVYLWLAQKDVSRRKIVWLIVGLWSVLLVGNLYSDYYRQSGQYEFHILQFLSILMIMLLVWMGLRSANAIKNLNWWAMYNSLVFVLLAATLFGRMAGVNIRDVNQNRYDVWLTSGTRLMDVKIVMLLSHHSIFSIGSQVVVIPSSEIKRIISAEN
jgi:hypothetical protein